MTKPVVLSWVDGGVGYWQIVSGEADVLFWDWDVVNDGEDREAIEAYLADAKRLPDDWPGRSDIIASMEDALAGIDDDA
jgi:hypothetical protein